LFLLFFYLMILRLPSSTLFPYTTLFRSILQDRTLLHFGKALCERIHFRLELLSVINLADLCIPSILGLAVGRSELLPDCLGRLGLHLVNELLYGFGHFQIRVGCGKHEDVHPNFAAFRLLRLDCPVRAQKDQYVQRDQRKGDDRPAAALHVLMAQRNQHRATLSNQKIERNSSGECKRRIRYSVTGHWSRVWPLINAAGFPPRAAFRSVGWDQAGVARSG